MNGFSEEFFPGTGSDPDFNMKLWNKGIRIFKGVNDCKVYHFGSVVLRNKLNKVKKITNMVVGVEKFFIKMGYKYKIFKKFYLQSNNIYDGPLKEPKINLYYLMNLFLCKLNYFYLKFFYKKL